MNKIIQISFLLLIGVSTFAQIKQMDDLKYRRSSLHLVLVTTDDPILKEVEVLKSWDNYPFPDKYNEHRIDLSKFAAGKPGVSFYEFATNYVNGRSQFPSSLVALKKMSNDLDNKAYTEAVKEKVAEKIEKEKLAHKLLEKWFQIEPDGSCNMDLIKERGAYNATEMDALEASHAKRGRAILEDAGEELIGNTFVQFCKMDFYENEPIAKFSMMLANAIAAYSGPAEEAVRASARVAYEASKEGYSARAMAMLYKLNWNDSIMSEFYNCWIADNKLDYQKFLALPFNMVFIGADISTSTAVAPFGFNLDEKKLIELTVVRNLDKLFAKMQQNYEVFKPKFPVISNPPLTAKLGLKEGVKGGEKFELLEQVWNDKLNKREYKRAGIVTIDKKQIWDNRYNAGEIPENPQIDKKTGEPVTATRFSKNKAAYPGMLLRQLK